MTSLIIEKYSGEEITCSLCLEKIENGSTIYRLPCNHIFHEHGCLDDNGIYEWLLNHGTCPYCRMKIDVTDLLSKYGTNEEEIKLVMEHASWSVDRIIAAQLSRKYRKLEDAIIEAAIWN